MISLDYIGVKVDAGYISPMYKMTPIMSYIGLKVDAGLIPHKNFFKPKITDIGVSVSGLIYGNISIQVIE